MTTVDLPLGESYTPSSVVRLKIVLLKLGDIFALRESTHRVFAQNFNFFWEEGGKF